LYVIIESGDRPVDEWLQAQFGVQIGQTNRAYASTQVVRIYVNGTQGIPANGSADVWLPFYTQLSDSTDGTTANQFIDWWNGGRVYFSDDAAQISADFALDAKNTNKLTLKTPGPCVGAVAGNNCSSTPTIFAVPTGVTGVASGLPPTDH